MIDELAKVVEHADLGAGYKRLVLEAPGVAAGLRPGQFVHVKVPALEDTALRRPFSVFDAHGGLVTILYKRVGRGTAALNLVQPGQTLAVEGPLGRGFPLECAGKALLVAGGYGVAPLYFLARHIRSEGVALFVGGRTAGDLLALGDFAALGVETHVATNDGTAGEKGFVTLPLDREINSLRNAGKEFTLFTCGPDGLLRAVSERAVSLGAKGWISVDRHMICGVGACFACIQKTVHGNARCCVDGPVFPAEDLVWN